VNPPAHHPAEQCPHTRIDVLDQDAGRDPDGYAALHGVSGRDDYTGVLVLLAGVVLLTVTAVGRWHTRRSDEPVGRRIVRCCRLAVVGLLALLQVAFPLAMAGVGTHRSPTPAAESPYKAVEMAADGSVVGAGYLPSRNRPNSYGWPQDECLTK
jgi:hypothetical protein